MSVLPSDSYTKWSFCKIYTTISIFIHKYISTTISPIFTKNRNLCERKIKWRSLVELNIVDSLSLIPYKSFSVGRENKIVEWPLFSGNLNRPTHLLNCYFSPSQIWSDTIKIWIACINLIEAKKRTIQGIHLFSILSYFTQHHQ